MQQAVCDKAADVIGDVEHHGIADRAQRQKRCRHVQAELRPGRCCAVHGRQQSRGEAEGARKESLHHLFANEQSAQQDR